jgi:hypothetical protein
MKRHGDDPDVPAYLEDLVVDLVSNEHSLNDAIGFERA